MDDQRNIRQRLLQYCTIRGISGRDYWTIRGISGRDYWTIRKYKVETTVVQRLEINIRIKDDIIRVVFTLV